jgi:hypothetical protein
MLISIMSLFKSFECNISPCWFSLIQTYITTNNLRLFSLFLDLFFKFFGNFSRVFIWLNRDILDMNDIWSIFISILINLGLNMSREIRVSIKFINNKFKN